MDFIMPGWKKSDQLRVRSVLFCLLTVFLSLQTFPCTAQTQGINIKDVNGKVIEDTYVINADIDYHFSAETVRALNHGIALQFVTRISVKKQRHWLWDKTMGTVVFKYRLQYHPLGGYYLVSGMNDGARRQFKKLSDVTDFLGTVKNYPLIPRTVFETDADGYYGQISVKLDIQSLPAPLRPMAYISTQWRLASPVYSWSIDL